MNGYRFFPDALVEYEDAIAYYELLQAGLGARFILEFDRTIALTLEFSKDGSSRGDTPPELGIRRRLIQRFGVEIDYMASDDMLVVLAVFHGRRRPGHWKHRLARWRS